MPGITTILTTAAATVGVVAIARQVKKKISEAQKIVKEAKKRAQSEVEGETLEFEKNPQTGTYEAKDVNA